MHELSERKKEEQQKMLRIAKILNSSLLTVTMNYGLSIAREILTAQRSIKKRLLKDAVCIISATAKQIL